MSFHHGAHTVHTDYPPPPSVEEDNPDSAKPLLQDLIYTIMNDCPEAYREYDDIIHDFNLQDAQDINDALHDLQSEFSTSSSEEEPSEEYETPPATTEHQPAPIEEHVHRYTVSQTPAQPQPQQHRITHLPNIAANEHLQPRVAPTLSVPLAHIPAHAQQLYERRSTNGPIYPRQPYREHQSNWAMYDEYFNEHVRGRHGNYSRVPTGGRRQRRRCQARELYPDYEEQYMRERAEERRVARAWEALEQAYLLTRQIDVKIGALKGLLGEVLRGGVGGGM